MQCDDFVRENLPEIIRKIADEVDPSTVCPVRLTQTSSSAPRAPPASPQMSKEVWVQELGLCPAAGVGSSILFRGAPISN